MKHTVYGASLKGHGKSDVKPILVMASKRPDNLNKDTLRKAAIDFCQKVKNLPEFGSIKGDRFRYSTNHPNFKNYQGTNGKQVLYPAIIDKLS
ncbi:MAG: hypothetical protein JNL60_08750 [Bacteroidia bacterium]|nr:hypothetical protein [Bacteroidia bacterium]